MTTEVDAAVARVFRDEWGRIVATLIRVTGDWDLAEESAQEVYDVRHACATTWLRAGVPLGELARRLGHSVETLVSTYIGALQGDDLAANNLIDATLATTRERIVATPPNPSHALPTRSRKTGRNRVTRGNSRAKR